MRNAKVERREHQLLHIVAAAVISEIVPEAKRNLRQAQAAPAAARIFHLLITLLICEISHSYSPFYFFLTIFFLLLLIYRFFFIFCISVFYMQLFVFLF